MIRYFAYGSDLHRDSIVDWCRFSQRALPRREELRPAVLAHHRICFPTYDEFWRGGVADIVPSPGKTVSGALMELSGHGLETLERLANRCRARRTIVRVSTYTGGHPVEAITFRMGHGDALHVPPSALYMKRLAEAASEIGLSMMWVMHLHSFLTLPMTAADQPVEAPVNEPGFVPRPARRARPSRPRLLAAL
jgi:gamma-glutamylcyclotransferase